MKILVRPKRSPASLATSIALHVLGIAALASIVFRYPLGQLMGIRPPEKPTEHLTFIAVQRQPTENSGGRPDATRAGGTPARLVAPQVMPTQLPVPEATLDTAPARAAGGDGDGWGVTGSGLATGLVPRAPDSRISLSAPDAAYRMPRSVSQDVDSIIDLAIGIAIDSLDAAAQRNKPPSWVKKTKDGGEWGLTPTYIALGKVKIPTALLALLPLNLGPSQSPVDVRRAAWIRADILENARRSMTEDDFRHAVKRIRERKERERQEKAASDAKKDAKEPTKPIPLTP